MSENYDEISKRYNQKIEIELLKRDVSVISKLCEKMDTTIEKIQQVASDISKIVSLQEQKMVVQEKINNEVDKALDLQQKEHVREIKELNEKIDRTETAILEELKKVKEDLSKKIGVIEAWRYTVMGAIAFAVWLIAQALDLAKLFS